MLVIDSEELTEEENFNRNYKLSNNSVELIDQRGNCRSREMRNIMVINERSYKRAKHNGGRNGGGSISISFLI